MEDNTGDTGKQDNNKETKEINIEQFLDGTGDIEVEITPLGGTFVFRRPGMKEKLRIASVSGYADTGETVIDWEKAANYILPLLKDVPAAFRKLMKTENVRQMTVQRWDNIGISHNLLIAILTLFLGKMNEMQGDLEVLSEN